MFNSYSISFQFPSSSPWYPSATPSKTAKISNEESEALRKVLPLVTFDCIGKTGYFPDSKFNCEVFHYCQTDGSRNTFHCPSHQLFNQLSMVCEEKSVHNSKLCKEGSISPSKLQKISNTKKPSIPQKISPIFQPTLNSNGSKDSPKKIMTLEDLLTYMNSGQAGREAEPTFISRFQKSGESPKSQVLPESAITTSKPEPKPAKDKKPSKSVDAQLSAEGSDQTFSVAKPLSKSVDNSKKKIHEDVSTEYDAIEGRKYKKHIRAGRVLDIEQDQQLKSENGKQEKKVRIFFFNHTLFFIYVPYLFFVLFCSIVFQLSVKLQDKLKHYYFF